MKGVVRFLNLQNGLVAVETNEHFMLRFVSVAHLKLEMK